MSKEQIEEMPRYLENHTCMSQFQAKIVSIMLCARGYLKQRDGEWKLGKSGCMYFCSCCGYAAHPREEEEWNFCPNCGAKMKGGAD